MCDWRIKKVVDGLSTHYILQKKLFGFLWWYNPDNIDGMITGVYRTRAEALQAHKMKTTERVVTYEEVSDERE